MSDLLDRIRSALVGLKMPRALEALDHTLQQSDMLWPRSNVRFDELRCSIDRQGDRLGRSRMRL